MLHHPRVRYLIAIRILLPAEQVVSAGYGLVREPNPVTGADILDPHPVCGDERRAAFGRTVEAVGEAVAAPKDVEAQLRSQPLVRTVLIGRQVGNEICQKERA